MDEEQYDYIKPQHYKLFNDNNDALVVIKGTLGIEGYKAFLIGNILKYQLRLGKKPNEPIDKDQKKISYYQDELTRVENGII